MDASSQASFSSVLKTSQYDSKLPLGSGPVHGGVPEEGEARPWRTTLVSWFRQQKPSLNQLAKKGLGLWPQKWLNEKARGSQA